MSLNEGKFIIYVALLLKLINHSHLLNVLLNLGVANMMLEMD